MGTPQALRRRERKTAIHWIIDIVCLCILDWLFSHFRPLGIRTIFCAIPHKRTPITGEHPSMCHQPARCAAHFVESHQTYLAPVPRPRFHWKFLTQEIGWAENVGLKWNSKISQSFKRNGVISFVSQSNLREYKVLRAQRCYSILDSKFEFRENRRSKELGI